MKHYIYIPFIILLLITESNIVFSQKTDALEKLNLLAFGGIAEIKYSIGGEDGGQSIMLDDSDWELTFPGFKWSQSNTNVWFRNTVEIPEKIGGFSLVGKKMTLFLYIDNGGDVFVNEKYLGSFEWGTAQFVISENIKAGDRYVIAVRGINRPGWGKVSEYRIAFSGMGDFQEKLKEKVWGLYLARRAAKKLSSDPDLWISRIEEVAEAIVGSDAFLRGNEQELLQEFTKQSQRLVHLGNELRSKYQLFCAGYSHIDLAWKWPWVETVEVVKNTTQSVLNIMNEFPDFKYSMGQAHAYEWLEKHEPGLFSMVKEKVKEGVWEIVGGQWAEPDGNLPCGESFVRQSLYAQRYFRKHFGKEAKICWLPDSFGFNWNLPQILFRSGIDAFITTRVDIGDTRNFPHRTFWWQGPDGSKILVYIPRDGYMHDLNGEQMIDFLAAEKAELNTGRELVIYGVGNHGGGPTIKMLERGMRVKNVPAYPALKLSFSQNYFESLTEQEKSDLPIWKSELYLERFRGCYTSQAKTKQNNREAQVNVKKAEKLSALASLYGLNYPREKVFEIWRTILFNQFHDILPGTSINAVYKDSEKDYGNARKVSETLSRRALNTLMQKIDTRGPGQALVIFNPLSWSRKGPVKLILDDMEMEKTWSVVDAEGTEIPVQLIKTSSVEACLYFIARDIPSYGYRVYWLINKSSAAISHDLKAQGLTIENKYLKISVDEHTGLIQSIHDKITEREILRSPTGNLLQIYKDEAHDAWNMRFDQGAAYNLNHAREVSLVENGPVRITLKVVQAYAGEKKEKPTEDFPSSFFTQYISLYDEIPYLEVRNDISWWEEHKILKVAFPVDIVSKEATYEIPYGSIRRSTGFETPFEKARYEVPAQSWADISEAKFGVALINETKHGYDIKDNIMRLTLLRSSTNPDPSADKGFHQFKYALYPHSGDILEGKVFQQSLEFNEPLFMGRQNPHHGVLENHHSFLTIAPQTVILNSLKMAEDDKDLVVRVYETAGREEIVQITCDRGLSHIQEVNLLEDKIAGLDFENSKFSFTIKPGEIRSFKIGFK